MKKIGHFLMHVVMITVVVAIVVLSVKIIGMVRELNTYRESTSDDSTEVATLSSVMEDTDVVDVIENNSGIVSAVTGIDYDVVETEEDTYVEITADELDDLATLAQEYTSDSELEAISESLGISIDEIAAGDYSSLGLSGDETYTISTEDLETALSMAEQYMNGE